MFLQVLQILRAEIYLIPYWSFHSRQGLDISVEYQYISILEKLCLNKIRFSRNSTDNDV